MNDETLSLDEKIDLLVRDESTINHVKYCLEKEGCDKITKKILIESMVKNFFNIFSNYNCGLKK